MSHTVTVLHAEGYLHVRIEGDSSAEAVASYALETRQLCQQYGVDKLLVETSMTAPPLATEEVYRLSVEAAESPIRLHKWAYVNTAPDRDTAMMEFAETVATNRGLRLRTFRSVDEARAWLEEEDSSADDSSADGSSAEETTHPTSEGT